jgi:putative endonuclease
MYYAYILKSEKDLKYYYGSTKNLENRLAKHNKGDVRATRGRRLLVIHYFEVFDTRKEAYNRELFFKSIDGYRWLKENNIN